MCFFKIASQSIFNFKREHRIVLASVGWWLEHGPAHRSVAGSVPHPSLGMRGKQPTDESHSR